MADREAGASPIGPVRTAPEGETQIPTPVSTIGHAEAETISRIPDGASEETEYVSPPTTVSHSVQDPDQSHLQISFTISLATMNVQMPQTIATSTHEPTSINSQCMLCKTASAQRHATTTTPGPGLDPTKVSVDTSTADHISKFHQGETLADWLKREPKCPELLLPESSHGPEGMTTVKPLFADEIPSTSAMPPGGEQSVSQPKEPAQYKKSALKKSKAAPLAKSEDLSEISKATRQETEGSEWTSQSSLIGPLAPPPERSSHVPQTTLNVSTEKQTQKDTTKELKPKQEKATKTEKIGPFSETPLLKLSRSTSPSSQTAVCPPQVGIVSPIRRLKPATELLEECQKYRMGHTAYRTRSHLRGARTEDNGKKPLQEASAKKSQDKENMSEGFVHLLAKRLSDEEIPASSLGSNDSTPKAGSVISLHHTDSPHSLTEIGYRIVCNIPSGQSEPTLLPQQSTQVQAAMAGAPLKDVTNGKKVKSVKIINGKGTSQETMSTRRRSFEIPKSSEFQPEYQAQSSSSTNIDGRTIDEGKPDSTISVSNSFSMPVLSSAEVQGDGARSRSATCSALSELYSAQSTDTISSESDKLTIPSERDITTREVVGSSVFYKISSPQVSKSSKSYSGEAEDSPKSESKRSEHARSPSPTSSDRRTGKKKKGTIGELCKQSMSFDLGISTSTPKETRAEKGSAESGSQSLEGAACKSTFEPLEAAGYEGEESLSSQQSDEKRKPRSRFFDSNWFQKSKKLFKVSK